MFVQCWRVGQESISDLAMTIGSVSGDLAADWIPSLPPDLGASLIGWPHHLLKVLPLEWSLGGNKTTRQTLILQKAAGRSERQWKGVLSWMLGVAGTRRYLHSDGYRWIAPASAFYPSNTQDVDLYNWHPSFPRTSLTVNAVSKRRLRPDYIALRPTSRSLPTLDWAVVEAKGTHRSLSGIANCPGSWSAQVRNVRMQFHERPVSIQRHLVVATRVNSNGKSELSRCLQVRAWNNRTSDEGRGLPLSAAVEIATAHLFGVFNNLHLPETARAIATAARLRHTPNLWNSDLQKAAATRAFSELDTARARARDESRTTTIDTFWGPINARISEPVLDLVQGLVSTSSPEEAIDILWATDEALNDWQKRQSRQPNQVLLPYGVELTLPEGWNTGEQR
jgi:hypothetical protein